MGLDANGNTLSDAQGRSFTWDFENRLTQVVVPGTNGGTTTFKYDPFGRRIQKSGPLGTTNYLYDGRDFGANILEELDNNGNVLARYVQSERIDHPLAEFRSGANSYYQQDALSSVTSLSSGAGALVNTYTYDSMGNVLGNTTGVSNPFQYTGREGDRETGLDYYRARYYDPTIGRFFSEDPQGLKDGVNRYTYARNNSVRFRDPLGLSACSDACEKRQFLFKWCDYRYLGFCQLIPPWGDKKHCIEDWFICRDVAVNMTPECKSPCPDDKCKNK